MRKFKTYYLVAISIVSLIIFHRIFYSIYLFGDSATFIFLDKDYFLYAAKDGRYLQGLFFKWFYASKDLKAFIPVRIFSLACWTLIVTSLLFMYKQIEGTLTINKQLFIYLTGIISLFNISTSLFIAWECNGQVGFGCLLALFSGHSFVLSTQTYSLNKRTLFILVSLLLTFLALSTYQTIATAFFIPIYFMYRKKVDTAFLFHSLLVFFMSLGIYFIVFKSTPYLLGVELTQRSTFVTDYIGKAIYFIKEPFKNALKIVYFNDQKRWFFIFPLFIIFYTLIIHPVFIQKKERKKIFIDVFIVISLIVLSYLPQLVVQENWASYRSSIVLIIVTNMILFDCLFLRLNYNIHVKKALFVILTSTIVVKAYYNVNTCFIAPQVHEFKMLSQSLEESNLLTNQKAIMIKPTWNTFEKDFGEYAKYDEFALPSTFIDWVTEPYLRVALANNPLYKPLARELNIRVEEYEYQSSPNDIQYEIFDMEKIIHQKQ